MKLKRLLLILGVLLGLLILAGIVSWLWIESRANRPRSGTGRQVAVEIPTGAGPKKVAQLLERAGVIEDAGFFAFYVRHIRRAAGSIKAGELAFRDDLSPRQALEVLLEGTPMTYSITFPEGLRIDEAAAMLEREGFIADASEFVRRARDPKVARSLGVPADGLEGFLFPDTYRLRHRMEPLEIMKVMVERYRTVFTGDWRRRARQIGLDEFKTVILASLVEKETGAAEERPLIAGVFHNRLRDGWRMDTDPSVIYAIVLIRGSFSGNLTRKDLEMDHPYNTYRHRGLPPGPICNPGREALQAALYPKESGYYFFVSRNDGTHEFCDTLACHNQAVKRFQGGGK